MVTAIIVTEIIINTLCMIACPLIAKAKGRSVAGWFFGGMLLGVIGLIIISCLD